MKKKGRSLLKKIESNLRTSILAGFVVAIPLILTYLVLRFLFISADGLLQPLTTKLMGRSVPGVGVVLTAVLLYLLGLITLSVLGRRLIRRWHALVERLPLVQNVYSVFRQVVDAFSGKENSNFRRVVMVEWPRPGVKSIGLVTGQVKGPKGETYLTVYLPTAPNPTSGFLALFPENEVVDTDMSIEEGLKMVISGGVLKPANIGYTPKSDPPPV